MFGWFGSRSRKRDATERLVGSEDDVRTVLVGLPENERVAVFAEAARRLLFDGRVARAKSLAEAALAVGPETIDALIVADDVFGEFGDLERCIEVCERLVDRSDEAEPHLARLALRLLEVGRAEEALEVLEVTDARTVDSALARAEVLVALERLDEALAILRDLLAHDTRRMKSALDPGDWQTVARRAERAQQLHDGVLAELEGAEQVVVAAMRAGRLDTRAAVNFGLLAESLMVESTYVPESTSLEDPAAVVATRFDERDAWSIARFASAKLRLGSVRDAKRLFERVRAVDGRCFAAYRGLAGVGLVERTRPFESVHSLPSHPVPVGIERVVVDWPNLTEVERRVVVASVHPLRAVLAPLDRAGARSVLLPIDVRTVDLRSFEGEAGFRFEDDHRSLDALGGVASAEARLAVSRIENLLGFGDPHGLVFAHELAHLAYFCMDEKNPFRDIYEWAVGTPHVATDYELSSPDEFFTGAYEAYLRRSWGLPSARSDDYAGVYAEVFACFEALERQG